MAQLKVLFQSILVIITLLNKDKIDTIKYNIILIYKEEYEIVNKDAQFINIKIHKKQILDSITNTDNPILKIEMLNGEYIIVKGNDILSSSTPRKCDYFYPLINNKIFINQQVISLIKCDGNAPKSVIDKK